MSKITLGGVELPRQTGFPKLKYEPIMLYSEPSVTGRLHNVYQRYFNKQFELNTVLFERVFTFEIVNIDEPTYNQLNAIDGTNCVLKFERDTYTEEFKVNLDMTFFKFDDHIWFDCVDISATVTEETAPPIIVVNPPTILHNIENNTIEMYGESGVTIYYTDDESDPTIESPTYEIPIPFVAGTYKAIAEDQGVISTITTEVFTATDWTPSEIATELWLDASDLSTITKDGSNIVSQWSDKSGNYRNATQVLYPNSRPSHISNNMIFALDKSLNGNMTSGTLSNGLTVVTVFKKTGEVQPYEAHPFNRTITNIANPIDYWRDQAYIGNGSTFGQYFLSDIAAQTTQCILATAINPTNINQYKNGIIVTETPVANQYQDNGNTYQIATRGDYVTKFVGEISEIVVCNGIVSINIRQKIEGYLAWKWDGINGNAALVASLPSNHPYKNSKPTA